MTTSEQRVLETFRKFLITPGQMLCFYGPNLEKNKAALERMTDKDLLVKEKFKGAYSLTQAGYRAMNRCQ